MVCALWVNSAKNYADVLGWFHLFWTSSREPVEL